MRAVLTIARVKPASLAAYVEACRVYADSTVGEEGCLRLDLVADDEQTRVCLVETYRDQAAYDAHLASQHFREWRDAVRDWYAEPPLVIRGSEIPNAGEDSGRAP